MHHHQDHTHHNHNAVASPMIIRHLLLLGFIFVFSGVVYLLWRNTTVVTSGVVMLVLAHIAAFVGIGWLGRSAIGSLVRRFHGASEPIHPHGDIIKTEGATISWARLYDVFVRLAFMGEHRKMMTSAVKLANIQANETVLDVGCGTGTLAIQAKESSPANVTVHGLDAAPEMIARAQKKAADKGVDVMFTHAAVEAIKADNETYDLVMNSLMVHHLPYELKSKAFAEMYRVLKVGGRLLIVDFEPPKKGLLRRILRLLVGDGMMQIDNRQVLPLLEAAGFTHLEKGQTDSQLATYISAKKTDTTH